MQGGKDTSGGVRTEWSVESGRCKSLDWGECRNYWQGCQRIPVGAWSILPYRGTVHDIGPTLTHKKIIIQQFVRNILTPEISKKTSRSEEACDRCIKGFKKVLKLHGDGIPAENIA